MKRILIYFLLLIGLVNTIHAQTLEQNNDFNCYDFNGIYLPIEFITSLEHTKNYTTAMNLNKDYKYYTVLIVTRDRIICDIHQYDTYQTVPVLEITKYQFEYNDGCILTDENGNTYKKISDDIDSYYNNTYNNFIINTVMKELIDQGGIIINDAGFIIPSLHNKRFGVVAYIYNYSINANLYLADELGNQYTLEISDNEYILYRLDTRTWERTTIFWSVKIE